MRKIIKQGQPFKEYECLKCGQVEAITADEQRICQNCGSDMVPYKPEPKAEPIKAEIKKQTELSEDVKGLWTAKQVAEFLGVSVATVYNIVAHGRLKAVKRIRINRRDTNFYNPADVKDYKEHPLKKGRKLKEQSIEPEKPCGKGCFNCKRALTSLHDYTCGKKDRFESHGFNERFDCKDWVQGKPVA